MESKKRVTPKLTAAQAAFAIKMVCGALPPQDQRILRQAVTALIQSALSGKTLSSIEWRIQ